MLKIKADLLKEKVQRDLAHLLFLLQESTRAGLCLFLSQNRALCVSGLSSLNTMAHTSWSKAPNRTELSQSCSSSQLWKEGTCRLLLALKPMSKHTAPLGALWEESKYLRGTMEFCFGELRDSPEKYKHAKQQLEAFPQELRLQINKAKYAEWVWSLECCCFVQWQHFIYTWWELDSCVKRLAFWTVMNVLWLICIKQINLLQIVEILHLQKMNLSQLLLLVLCYTPTLLFYPEKQPSTTPSAEQVSFPTPLQETYGDQTHSTTTKSPCFQTLEPFLHSFCRAKCKAAMNKVKGYLWHGLRFIIV